MPHRRWVVGASLLFICLGPFQVHRIHGFAELRQPRSVLTFTVELAGHYTPEDNTLTLAFEYLNSHPFGTYLS